MSLKQYLAKFFLDLVDWLESIALPEDDSTKSNVEMAEMRKEANKFRKEIRKDL